jgi:hypothetical protein
MLSNKKSFLKKFIIAKNEFVSMKLHFRYHTYLYTKNGGTVYEGCKYCQDRLVNDNGKNGKNSKIISNEDENKKSV